MDINVRTEPIVSDAKSLAELAHRISQADAVAVDTEFVRESTYFAKLCCIQVGTESMVACVDCLAELDLEPLFDSLYRANCTWVIHSARQDLEVIWNESQQLAVRLFDTQIAAALIGFAPQLGLAELLTETLGVNLDKDHTRTDWTRRPLPDAALRYALDDVRYLLEVRQYLEDRLIELGRLQWFEEDIRRFIDEPPVADVMTVWQRLRGLSGLPMTKQCAALSLVRWRETRAQQLNRPRRWILSDELLTHVAKTMPRDLQELGSIAAVPRRLVSNSGDEILAAVERSTAPDLHTAVERITPSRKPDRTQLKMLQSLVKERASQLQIHSEVLATKRELSALAAGQAPARLAAGWRSTELKQQ